MKGSCIHCKKEKDIAESGKSEGFCHVCYKKILWKPKLLKCRRCNRELPMHAKGLCAGCYNSVFHIEQVNRQNVRKLHNLDMSTYGEITKSCIICGFDKIVDLHHIDRDHKNTSRDNLVGLCPNHHKMVHNRKYRLEVYNQLKEKGFKVPETYESDEVFKIVLPKILKLKKEKLSNETKKEKIEEDLQEKTLTESKKRAPKIDLQKELEKVYEYIKSGKFDL